MESAYSYPFPLSGRGWFGLVWFRRPRQQVNRFMHTTLHAYTKRAQQARGGQRPRRRARARPAPTACEAPARSAAGGTDPRGSMRKAGGAKWKEREKEKSSSPNSAASIT